MSGIIVAKIGGSTLGQHDTTLQDIAELRRQGLRPLIVHGGGARISQWLERHQVPTRFERGLRVTDEESLRVVVAVLAGLVNKELVATLHSLDVPASGLCGADGGLLRARILDPALGLVGEITEVHTPPLVGLLERGVVPVIAPVALEWSQQGATGRLLNINADTAAGAIAAALEARALVFLTDVIGILDGEGKLLPLLSQQESERLVGAGVISGGMLPKLAACFQAARAGVHSIIVDGRTPGALQQALGEKPPGTVIT